MIKDLRTIELDTQLAKDKDDFSYIRYLREDEIHFGGDVDPKIHTGDEVLINIKYSYPEGVQGKVILEEKGRGGRMQRIVFQSKAHKPNEYDILYLNGNEGLWKSDCWDYPHDREGMLEGCEEEYEEDEFNEILEFLKRPEVDVIATNDIPGFEYEDKYNIWAF